MHGERAVGRVLRDGDGGAPSIAGRPLPKDARLVIAAVGKASAAMTRALLTWAGPRVAGGVVVSPETPPLAGCAGLLCLSGGHPIPDARSARAGTALIDAARACRPNDVLVVLLSGGASALAVAPAPGVALADVAATTGLLLASGADIAELNCVRKHLSALAGGGLAATTKAARVELLAISDVPGDRLEVIGSGPCSGDSSRYGDALDVLSARGILAAVPIQIRQHLEAGARGERPESLFPDDPRLAGVHGTIVARNADARAAAVAAARAEGARALDLGECLHGPARESGRRLAHLGLAMRPGGAPVFAVGGGETTVEVHGSGSGGRSQELALAAAMALDSRSGVQLLAAGTDGRDGPTDAAGAFADGESVVRGARAGMAARAALDDNDSHAFFACEGGLLRTGPTDTNVMDLVHLWIEPAA